MIAILPEVCKLGSRRDVSKTLTKPDLLLALSEDLWDERHLQSEYISQNPYYTTAQAPSAVDRKVRILSTSQALELVPEPGCSSL